MDKIEWRIKKQIQYRYTTQMLSKLLVKLSYINFFIHLIVRLMTTSTAFARFWL
ncbi:unnamed protein product [Acanthoscelides obtectus]|uniref:Uncharacterized protein n=1 Tax=Acanthoscelides obtectus TaxID=200917 RepID=A0A9P0JPP9_ACAOB|nr:unnamed protein product [Acanthoscelides obtectus]CAK1661109.1 hypothetical protein AOBTE_LOCUS22445 [Acanthoscelides obtectus]